MCQLAVWSVRGNLAGGLIKEGLWGGGLSNFCTYMDYLYCMPKWSHSRFYEIKLLINISIYWYIKFIKTVSVWCLLYLLYLVFICVTSGCDFHGLFLFFLWWEVAKLCKDCFSYFLIIIHGNVIQMGNMVNKFKLFA